MKKRKVIKWLTVLLALVGAATQGGLLPPVVGEVLHEVAQAVVVA